MTEAPYMVFIRANDRGVRRGYTRVGVVLARDVDGAEKTCGYSHETAGSVWTATLRAAAWWAEKLSGKPAVFHLNQSAMVDVLCRRACASRDTDAVMRVLAAADAGGLTITHVPNAAGNRHMARAYDLAGGKVHA